MATILIKEGEELETVLKRFKKASAHIRREEEKRRHFLSPKQKKILKRSQNRKFAR